MIAKRYTKPSALAVPSSMMNVGIIQNTNATNAPTPGTMEISRVRNMNDTITNVMPRAAGITVTPSSHMAGNPQSMVRMGHAGRSRFVSSARFVSNSE